MHMKGEIHIVITVKKLKILEQHFLTNLRMISARKYTYISRMMTKKDLKPLITGVLTLSRSYTISIITKIILKKEILIECWRFVNQKNMQNLKKKNNLV